MAFVAEAALIALREGLEAFLITGILLGLVTRMGRPDVRKHVWLGFGAAALTSLAAGYVVQRWLLAAFEERGGAEWFELGAALVAVVILTYMVFWMWKQTRELIGAVRERVAASLTAGTLFGIVALTYASVIREGLEVVLFYAALGTRHAPLDMAWSGALGFAASALLVVAILRGAGKVDLSRFFGITGVMLVFIAAGLLVHGVYAATAVGLLEPAPRIWDTSAYLGEDGATGRVLHALVGYAATPTLLQALLYFGYVFGFGGWYLWSLGAFHRRSSAGRARRPAAIAALALAILLVAATVGYGAANPGAIVEDHDHAGDEMALASLPAGEKVGILLRSHGEPIHYNETTYQSFADFVEGLLVTMGMENLLLVDQGTVLLDKAHPFERGMRTDTQLMDAWTHDFSGPAFYGGSPVPQLRETANPIYEGYYLAPGPGPGLGEPDILEIAGLSAYVEWLQMDNTSPMHESKGKLLDAAERLLRERYGDQVVIQRSYHILPKVGAGESDAEAAEAFKAAGVTLVVDAYTTTVFSDVMNTCMMQPHLEHALEDAGYAGSLVHARSAGTQEAYAHAVAREVAARLAETPEGEPVAVFLTHHGSDPAATSPCGDGADAYNANAKALYDATIAALAQHVARDDVRFYQVYGQGADAPDDGVLSPMEALAKAKEDGARRVLDLPYELTGNGFDNLVAHRASYGLEPERAPHYDASYETRLTLQGMDVRILSSDFETEKRAEALVDAIGEALSSGGAAGGHTH